MAIALVQSAQNGVGSSSSLGVTYSGALTSGTLLVATCAVYEGSDGNISISDSAGHTWTPVLAEQETSSGAVVLRTWTAPNSGTATPTVTFTHTSGSYLAGVVAEFSGVDSTTPLDGVTPVTNSATSLSVSTGNITPATNNAWIVGAMAGDWVTLNDITITVTNGTAIQERETWATDMVVALAREAQTTATAEAVTWTVSGTILSNSPWIAHAFVLREASGGTQSITPTGASVSVSAGTLTVEAAAAAQNVTPTGPTVSVSAGSLVVGENIGVTGPTVTITPGTVTVTAAQPVSLTGASVSVTPGGVGVMQGLWPSSIDAMNKRILDQNGDPWFGVGDTAWSLVGQLSNADITTYMEGVAAEGVNFVLFNAPEPNFTDNTPADRNQAGYDPFTGTRFQSSINDNYWQTVDHAVREAGRLGITCLICPQYIGYNDTEGYGNELTAAYTADPGNLTTYGQEIAARYAPYPNIVWLIGHDRPSMTATHKAASKLIADELPSAQLLTLGGDEGDTTGDASWSGSGITSDFNTVYDYDDNPGGDTATAWSSKTVIFLEGKYEQEQSIGIGAQLLREQMWEPFCAGASAAIFGNNPRWHFESGKELYSFSGTWQQSITNATYNDGTVEAGYLADFISSVTGVLDTLPDTTGTALTAGTGYARFDTNLIVVYSTAASSITLDTTELAGTGTVRIRRYDPTTGSFTTVAASEAQNSSRSITYPGTNSAGGTDWVYVVDLTGGQTVSPSGPTVNVTAGTLSVDMALTLSGPTVTVTPGTLTVAPGAVDINPTGPTITVTPGSLSVTAGTPVDLVGPTVNVTPGTLSLGVDIPLTGPTVTVTPGSITVTQGLAVVPTGPTVNVTPGTLTVTTGAVDVTPVGASVTVTPGTLTVLLAQPLEPVGPTITVTPGTLTVRESQPISLVGPTVSVTAGTLSLDVADPVLVGATVTVTPGTLVVDGSLLVHQTVVAVTYRERSYASAYRERAYASTYREQ